MDRVFQNASLRTTKSEQKPTGLDWTTIFGGVRPTDSPGAPGWRERQCAGEGLK